MRLFFNLYGMPLCFVLSSYFLHRIGYHWEDNRYLGQLGIYIVYAGKASAVVAGVWMIANLWKLYQAYQGKGDICERCGYPETYIAKGRYGPYFKCWKCGANCSQQNHIRL